MKVNSTEWVRICSNKSSSLNNPGWTGKRLSCNTKKKKAANQPLHRAAPVNSSLALPQKSWYVPYYSPIGAFYRGLSPFSPVFTLLI